MKEITPYLIFDGNCREAMTFYQQALGGELFSMTYGESAGPSGHVPPPDVTDRLIHARLQRGSTVIMASDNGSNMPYQVGNNAWMSLACERDDEVESLFTKLVAGGKEIMRPHDAFWGSRFAMLTDRFGVNWMLTHERQKPELKKS